MNRLAPYIMAALFFLSAISYAEVVDRIAIIVNDEIICDSEIEGAMMPVYEKFKMKYTGQDLMTKLEEARQSVVEQLIEDRLIYCEAKKQNITVEDREVEARFEDTRKRFGTQDEFEEALAMQHMTAKELKSRYKEQLMTKRMIDMKMGGTIVITPVEVSNYYNSHPGDFKQPEALKLRNILIKPKDTSDTQRALNTAKDVLKKVKEGGDFAELAKTYSEGPGAEEGGLMGYVTKEDLMPEIVKAVSGLEEGSVSDIVQTSLGYHIFKLEEKRPESTMPLADARRRIEEEIYREKMKAKIKDWVEGLKKNAYIAFK
jgi:parvulin-like peptidyl-prolyl isomerase